MKYLLCKFAVDNKIKNWLEFFGGRKFFEPSQSGMGQQCPLALLVCLYIDVVIRVKITWYLDRFQIRTRAAWTHRPDPELRQNTGQRECFIIFSMTDRSMTDDDLIFNLDEINSGYPHSLQYYEKFCSFLKLWTL